MNGARTWSAAAEDARRFEAVGINGLVFTESGQTPWMLLAAAGSATTSLELSTGVAVAFPRSPMVTASLAWDLAANTRGRFRLGLGSQVKAHIERRYGVDFDPAGPRMADYLSAVNACLAAFRGDAPLNHRGEYYQLTLLPDMWRPPSHQFGDISVDVSAVGPWMTRMAGELADGVHVHPLHSMHYLEQRLEPSVTEGARRVGRDPAEVDLLIPVFIVPGDTPEERAALTNRARTQVAFYGSTRNYAFQFDDLGFEGTSGKLNTAMKSGDIDAMTAVITDEILDHFAVFGRWEEIADLLMSRVRGSRRTRHLLPDLRRPGSEPREPRAVGRDRPRGCRLNSPVEPSDRRNDVRVKLVDVRADGHG